MQLNNDIKISQKKFILGIGVIFIITILIYLPALRGGFVWDDNSFLYENPIIKADNGLSRFWFSTEPPDYFPLTSTTLWLEWRIWGMDAFGYHLINVLLHIFSSVLIWLILSRLKIPGAFLAALIFAVHPVNVESVAWITQRKSTLPMVFYLLSILLFLKYEDKNRWLFFGLSLGAFLLALLSKTSVVMLPFVIIGIAWWQRRRIVKKDLLLSLPYFALSAILSLITIWFQYNRSIGDDIIRTDGFFSRLAGAGWAVWFYLYKAVLPLKVIFVYPLWKINDTALITYIPGIILTALIIIFWFYRNSWGRPFLFGAGYFIITLFPVMGFFNIYYMKYSLVADHYQYQSIIGIIALIVGLAYYLYKKRPGIPVHIMQVSVSLVIILLCFQTWQQAGNYKDTETLFRDTINKNPKAWMANYNLGHHLQDQQRFKEAIHYYSNALRIQPENPDPLNNIGNILLLQGNINGAITSFQKAVKIMPGYQAYYNLGNALMQKGSLEKALYNFYKSLRINPKNHMAHNNTANTLAQLGRQHQAIAHYSEALRINPRFIDAHINFGIVLKRLGRFKEAINHFSTVINIQPGHPKAHRNLKSCTQMLKKSSDVSKPGIKP